MRPIRAILQLLAGMALGAGLAYWGLRWLRAQEHQVRRRLDEPSPRAGATLGISAGHSHGGGFLDQVTDRFRSAVEEGRRAAAAARAELEAEIKHQPPPAPAL